MREDIPRFVCRVVAHMQYYSSQSSHKWPPRNGVFTLGPTVKVV